MAKKLVPIRLNNGVLNRIDSIKARGNYKTRTVVMERAIEYGLKSLQKEIKDKKFFVIYFFLSLLFLNYSTLAICITFL